MRNSGRQVRRRQRGFLSEFLHREILRADFVKFPGDLKRFEDDRLRREGVLDEFHDLLECYAEEPLFDKLESTFIRGQASYYRFLVLVHVQNRLRAEDLKRLRSEEAEQREKESEGGAAWCRVMQVLEPSRADYWRAEEQRMREEWRRKCEQQEAKRRRRSGRPQSPHSRMDWTEPHTAQDFLDAFGQARISLRRHVAPLLKKFRHLRFPRRGRNQPVYYSFETGLEVLEHGVRHWLKSDEQRKGFLLSTVAKQVLSETALTSNANKLRALLLPLWNEFWTDAADDPLMAIAPSALANDEIWAAWHAAIPDQATTIFTSR